MPHPTPSSDVTGNCRRACAELTQPECDRIVGFDIGGTKCAVCRVADGVVEEFSRIETGRFQATFDSLCEAAERVLPDNPRFGVSCGGPLDSARGIIVSPPNLDSSWHGVGICELLTERFGGVATLMNDANACALAEWRFGAGRGCRHMIFLTSGTGMGAGLILNGQLFEGASGDAGEVGHIRLSTTGPVGFGKAGSFEGFCSGGGIARHAAAIAREQGASPGWLGADDTTTTRRVAEAAAAGESLAIEVMHETGRRLGQALAILIDSLNPERIVLGGFYPKTVHLLEAGLLEALRSECLPHSLAACTILPAELGETIGSHGAIAVALYAARGS